jgi:hypothetical protein
MRLNARVGSRLPQRFSTGIRHRNTHILPTHRLLPNIANVQKVPVSRCSLEAADDALTRDEARRIAIKMAKAAGAVKAADCLAAWRRQGESGRLWLAW